MKKLLLVVIFLAAFSADAFATAQAPDILFHDGKFYNLFSNPLEDFYKNEKSRPRFMIAPNMTSSGNWRGYVAYWEIENDSLYLKALDSWTCGDATETGECRRTNLKELFAGKYEQGKVFAVWFTGELRLPEGKLLQYLHAGYGSIYEKDVLISVQSGRIIGNKIVDNTNKVPKSK